MSHAHVRDLSGSKAEQTIEAMLDELPGLLSTASRQYLRLLRGGSRVVVGLLPSGLLAGRNDCCSVPTQNCPPRCIAEIAWWGCACEEQRAVVTVTNSASHRHVFTFTAGSLGPASVQVVPPAAELAPGQSVDVMVTVAPNQGLVEDETYTGELLVKGAYEQCVKLRLRLSSVAVPKLRLAQGDPPERITELKWYRHWQCTETCVPDERLGDALSNDSVDPPPVNRDDETES